LVIAASSSRVAALLDDPERDDLKEEGVEAGSEKSRSESVAGAYPRSPRWMTRGVVAACALSPLGCDVNVGCCEATPAREDADATGGMKDPDGTDDGRSALSCRPRSSRVNVSGSSSTGGRPTSPTVGGSSVSVAAAAVRSPAAVAVAAAARAVSSSAVALLSAVARTRAPRLADAGDRRDVSGGAVDNGGNGRVRPGGGRSGRVDC
jgi:hypothetical protein